MIEALPPAPTICPTGNPCNIKLQEGPRCGTSEEYFPPELLAEQICPWAIAGAIQLEKDQPTEVSRAHRSRAIARKEFLLGSLHAELALAYPAHMMAKGGDADMKAVNETKRKHEAAAKTHLDEAASRFRHSGGVHASFLRLYVPVSTFRNFQTISLEYVTDLQQGLLDIADQAKEHPWRRNIEGRVGLHLLHARQSRLAFPSSARELAYTGGPEQEENPLQHHLYTFDNSGTKKIPYRVTPAKRMSGRSRARVNTPLMEFGSIAYHAYAKVAPNTVRHYDEASDAAFDLLYTDANGDALRPTENRILDIMAQTIDSRRKDYMRRMADNS